MKNRTPLPAAGTSTEVPELTKTEHTPGAWKIATSGYANAPSVIYAGDKGPDFGRKYPLQGCDWIAEVKEDESPRAREYHANARLIAASPELLDELEKALRFIARNCPDSDQRQAIIQSGWATIRKSRGAR